MARGGLRNRRIPPVPRWVAHVQVQACIGDPADGGWADSTQAKKSHPERRLPRMGFVFRRLPSLTQEELRTRPGSMPTRGALGRTSWDDALGVVASLLHPLFHSFLALCGIFAGGGEGSRMR